MCALRNRPLLLLGALAALVGGYLLFWYAQSPVGPSIYPARLGGTIVTDGHEPRVRLPVIWLRPHPWAEHPPAFYWVALVGEAGDGLRLQGSWRPAVQWPDRGLPLWRRPRAVQGDMEVPFPADGFTVTGVRWQVEGEPEKVYRTGPVNPIWTGQEKGSLSFSGGLPQYAYPHAKPGQPFNQEVIEGYYLFMEGHGRIVEIIPAVAGAKPPVRRWSSRRTAGGR